MFACLLAFLDLGDLGDDDNNRYESVVNLLCVDTDGGDHGGRDGPASTDDCSLVLADPDDIENDAVSITEKLFLAP